MIMTPFLVLFSEHISARHAMGVGNACRTCKQAGPRAPFRRARPGELSQNEQADDSDPISVVALPAVPDEVLVHTPQLLSCSAGTLKNIPKQWRRAWGDAYATALQRLHEHLDVPSAWGVIALPRLTHTHTHTHSLSLSLSRSTVGGRQAL